MTGVTTEGNKWLPSSVMKEDKIHKAENMIMSGIIRDAVLEVGATGLNMVAV